MGSGAGAPLELSRIMRRDELPHHSQRSDTIGSTFAARRAGIQQASSATTINNIAIEMNVSGSVALTPFNIGTGKIELVRTRVSASANSRPALNP
jgi:hypothetical protein